jgi:quercetin dioxygenase-like cupin family protein
MKASSNNIVNALHTDWASAPVENIAEGIERQMIVGEKIMICRLRFAPNLVTPAHDHPHEQMTLVEQGRVLFTIGEQQRVAQAGDVLYFPSGVWHGATMLEEEVVLIDIFSPIREDFLASTSSYSDNGATAKED